MKGGPGDGEQGYGKVTSKRHPYGDTGWSQQPQKYILLYVLDEPWGTPSHGTTGLSQGARCSWGPSLHPQSSAASPWAHKLPPRSIPSAFP